MQNRTRRAAIPFLSALAGIGLGVGKASAGQQQWSSQYVNWTADGLATEIYNLDQVVWFPRPADNSYWPLQWTFQGSGTAGYLGIQQESTSLDQNVRFSIWNATKAKGRNCQPFGGEGIGQTCTLPIKINPKKFYRLRLWVLHGRWWGGWLIETDGTGALVEHEIGQILAPVGATFPDPSSIANFVEYFGPSYPACDRVPLSIVGFTPPTANYAGSGVYQGHFSYGGSQKADGNHCKTGRENAGAFISPKPYDFGFADGVMMFLGKTLDKHKLSAKQHPTPPQMPDE